ncbi:MAG: glucokinase [Desulfovibrionaceae bacterium]
MMRLLVADIGGTNARFAHFEAPSGRAEALRCRGTAWLPTADAHALSDLLELLKHQDFPLAPEAANAVVLAMAGPVRRGRQCALTNAALDVDLDIEGPLLALGPSKIINDFEAQAFACRTAAVADAQVALPGVGQPDGAVAVIGAGTGLGKCALVPLPYEDRHVTVPSEGGHATFPFASREEFEYLAFVRARTGREHVIGDLVLSGTGLTLLHAFLHGEERTPREVTAAFTDDAPTLAWMARFYGRACRNYALEVLATGGVYVTGGIAAKTPALVTHPAFAAEFRSSDTHGPLLGRIPVLLNANEDSGLWGAALCALQLTV